VLEAVGKQEAMMNRRSTDIPAAANGFTLIELMFVLVVLAVLLSLAAPSMSALVRDQRVKTVVGDVHATLLFARSEAIKRNSIVAVCASNQNDPAFSNSCLNSTDWSQGWIVFLDADGNGFPGAVSDVLRRQQPIEGLAVSGTGSNVSYQGDGRLRANPPQFVVSSAINPTATTARCVNIDLSGRPNIRVDTNKNPADGCQ
jgi:type IV fimbrial biogenesis protein FimT